MCNKENEGKEIRQKQIKVENFVEAIGVLMGVLPVLYVALNTIYVFSYRNKCEAFYGIPGEHFKASIDSLIVSAVIGLFLLIAPFLWNQWAKKSMQGPIYILTRISLSICFGTVIGAVSSVSLYNYFNNSIVIWVFSGIAVLVMLGIMFYDGWTKNKSQRTKNIFVVVITVFAVVFSILFGRVIFDNQSTDPTEKVSYEMVVYEEVEYFVLSEDQGKLLIVPFDVNDGIYKLKTNTYRIVDQEECIFYTIDLDSPPKVLSEPNAQ